MSPTLRIAVLSLLFAVRIHAARADGSADNVPAAVRPIPPKGIELPPEIRRELEGDLQKLRNAIEAIPEMESPSKREFLPDILVCEKAVREAIRYGEFFKADEVDKAREILAIGKKRAAALVDGNPAWGNQTGLVVRGYTSRIDGSVQPYGLVVPESYAPVGAQKCRLDVWFHGRGETLSELNFLDQRRKSRGEFAPADTIVLHPYGRYCNAFKFAGEIDVLEAIQDVQRRYRIDPDRISVRGFSMGGAACWQFAVHYPDHWFAANPGAGFAETRRFLETFQKETLKPSWYEEKLWHLYDCTDYAVNLAQCPTVAYSGALDTQKQAADIMAEALQKEGIDLVHVIGPETKHAYEPNAKAEVARRMESLAEAGRRRYPREVHFTTYTLRYNQSNGVTIDRLGEHWKKARIDVHFDPEGLVTVDSENVDAFTLAFPPGFAPFAVTRPIPVSLGYQTIETARPGSDRSWKASFHRKSTGWTYGPLNADRPSKKHGLQGPIDDAFMDSFVFVRPTGKSKRARFQAWCDQEMARAIEHWRKQFRGEVRVVDDTKVSPEDIARSNLVIWGDADSNALLKNPAFSGSSPGDGKTIAIGDRTFDAENHALLKIQPNPLNPERYAVFNSGFTYREYDYLNNARQVPKLPDWAVIDLRTPPDTRAPGKVVAAGFFDESWNVKPGEGH